jgi:threonine aldolase
VQELLERTDSGRVSTRIGALSIESPVRRLGNVAVPLADLEKALAPAREAGIGLHLDGARLPLYLPHFGIDPATVAALFDTVYVSLYKCFSAPSGAILAGPADLLDTFYHTRRMFGGGISAAWPFAALALHHMDDYAVLSKQAVDVAEGLLARLNAGRKCLVDRVPNGTNVFKLQLAKGDPIDWRRKLRKHGLVLPKPHAETGIFTCNLNPTWARSTADDLEKILLGSL